MQNNKIKNKQELYCSGQAKKATLAFSDWRYVLFSPDPNNKIELFYIYNLISLTIYLIKKI